MVDGIFVMRQDVTLPTNRCSMKDSSVTGLELIQFIMRQDVTLPINITSNKLPM